MAQNKIKMALVGCGYWGANLLRNMLAHPAIEVAGVVEKNPQAQQKCRTMYPRIRIESDLTAFLLSTKVDAVAIATPPQVHCDLAIECLRADCHVLVEKPLALSVEDCDKILSAAEPANRVVMVDHTFLYHPAVTYLADQSRAGTLGNLQFYDSVRVNLGGFQLTNVLWDLAPHDISILDLLTGQRMPTKVSAFGVSHFGAPSESMCYVTIMYDDNFIAHLHLNWAAPVKVRQIMIGGTEKMAVYDDNFPTEKIRIYDRGVQLNRVSDIDLKINYRIGDMVAPAIRQTEALSLMIDDFVQGVQKGKQPISDGHCGRRVVQILQAIETSMGQGGIPVHVAPSGLMTVKAA